MGFRTCEPLYKVKTQYKKWHCCKWKLFHCKMPFIYPALRGEFRETKKNAITYFGVGLISCPFLYHFRSTVGSARSTTRRIFPPLSTWYAGSSFFAKALKIHQKIHQKKLWLHWKTNYLPSLFFSSFGIFFILLSRPLRSVIPYMKAIFSYSSGRAFFKISHTSTSGVSSCCFGSLVVPDTRRDVSSGVTGKCLQRVLRNC